MSFIYIKNIIDKGILYSQYLIKELISYANYINALFIGIIINFLSGNSFPGKIAPFVVPVIVQSLSKSAIRFRDRHKDRILQLPSEREDPVFIMNETGDIILSPGITEKVFKQYGINNIKEFIGEDSFNYIIDVFNDHSLSKKQVEVYSEINNFWYEVKIKPISSGLIKSSSEYLIWFVDITAIKNHESRLSDMLEFSSNILSSIPKIVEEYDIDGIYKMLAEFILNNGYKGVFITRLNKEDNLQGYVFTYKNDLLMKSDNIIILKESSAPVLRSRKKEVFISGDISTYSSRNEFETDFPFDERVKEFLSFPINNFVNYHADYVSVITFNKNGLIDKYDKVLMEIIVNNVRIVLGLVDLLIEKIKGKN